MVAVTPAAVRALDVVRSVGIGGGQKGVRAVEVADLPAGEGNRQSSRPFRLGVLQRPQRARGHGPPDGPERRPHPRDRTPGPLETGRRHGRPLHPRRSRGLGTAVPLTAHRSTLICRAL